VGIVIKGGAICGLCEDTDACKISPSGATTASSREISATCSSPTMKATAAGS